MLLKDVNITLERDEDFGTYTLLIFKELNVTEIKSTPVDFICNLAIVNTNYTDKVSTTYHFDSKYVFNIA